MTKDSPSGQNKNVSFEIGGVIPAFLLFCSDGFSVLRSNRAQPNHIFPDVRQSRRTKKSAQAKLTPSQEIAVTSFS